MTVEELASIIVDAMVEAGDEDMSVWGKLDYQGIDGYVNMIEVARTVMDKQGEQRRDS